METTINYGICRDNLGEVSDAQYSAYCRAVREAIVGAFPGSRVDIGDSGFCNASMCAVHHVGPFTDDTEIITREDVETVVGSIGEEWWNG